jgi:hypothetical protein
MNDCLRSVVLGTSGLAVAASVALAVTMSRAPVRLDRIALKSTRALVVTCVILQGAHFLEEYATRFYQRFPARFSLTPWSATFFVAFNLVWLLVWTLSVLGLRSGARVVIFPLWFLAIAMMLNGIAHPLLAVDAGGYFPGLITAPVLGVAGAVLWMRLLSLTSRDGRTAPRRSEPGGSILT